MRKPEFFRRLGIFVAVLLGYTGPVDAELPTLDGETHWLGYFVGYENRRCSLELSTKSGQLVLRPVGKSGKTAAKLVHVTLDCVILETLPDGSTAVHQLIPETLESDQEATQEPENLTIRGKVKGDASFEFILNEDHGKFSLGGRVMDPGSMTQPLRFAVHVEIKNPYPYEPKTPDKQRQKTFAEKIKRDRITLMQVDGKRLRPSVADAVEAGVNGTLISEAQLEFNSWLENRLKLEAMGESSLCVEAVEGQLCWKGLSFLWTKDAAADPEGPARLEFEMR